MPQPPNKPVRPGGRVRRALRIPERSVEADIADEIAFHLDSRVRDLVAQGHTDTDARRIALSEYGDPEASERELAAIDRRLRRRHRSAERLASAGQDLRHAVRSLRRTPAFTVAALGTLSIGIAGTVAMFGIVNSVLLRPLPYRDPGRLVGAWYDMPKISLYHTGQSVPTYFTYRTHAHTIDGIGLYFESAANVSAVGQATDAQRLAVAGATASLFRVLGAQPLVGRIYSEDEDKPGGPPVAVISEGMWRAQFGGDPHIVGRKVEVNGDASEIIGVLPRSFAIPSSHIAVWLPLNLNPLDPPPVAFTFGSIARLKPGVSLSAAQRDFAAVLPRAADLYPKFVPGITTREIMAQTDPKPVLTPLRDDITGGVARTLCLTGVAAMLLYLVACVNVGNLVLVRFDARGQELAVRQALGASAARLARSYFTEVAVIAAGAGVAAVLIARAILALLVRFGPADLPRRAEIGLDWRCAAFALAVSALAALGSGAIPSGRIRRGGLRLQFGTRGGTASRAEHRVRHALVAAQIACALVVMAGSGLLFRSFARLHAVRPGFDADGVATFWVSLPPARYRTDSSVVRFYAELLERTAALPGVVSTGLTTRLPLVARGYNENPIYPESSAPTDTKLPPLQLFVTVGGDYFRTMGMPLLAGKRFDAMTSQREGDAIISSRTAALFWHDSTGRSVIGKRFRVLPTSRWFTVVGVLANAHDSSLAAAPSPTVYFPETEYSDSAQHPTARTMALTARTSGDPAAISAAVTRVIQTLDPMLPVFDVQSMQRAVRASTAQLQFTMLILGGAAAITLALGAIGLYGVMAYVVMLRRREIGIRIALGATPRAVAVATTGEAVIVTAVGLAAGLVLFAGVAPFVRATLYGVLPWDPLAVGGAVSTLLGIAVLASWLPARRAAGVDPASTLRAE